MPSREEALQKLRAYCAYQERSHGEVVQKLWKLKVYPEEHNLILSTLIEEDYLNEARYAEAFAGGKFRMKGWGPQKILYALKEKGVSEYNIRKAMSKIEAVDHTVALQKLAEKKWAALKGQQYMVRQKKTTDFLVRKGYAYGEVAKVIAVLKAK